MLKHLPKSPGIYRIFAPSTGQSYIGKSIDVRKRVGGHFSKLRNGGGECRRLNEFVAAKGIFEISAECLEECDVDRLDEREWFWVKELKPSFNCVTADDGPTFYEGLSAQANAYKKKRPTRSYLV